MRIVVAARAVGVPDQGGATWAALQYVLGFRLLGHDVLLVESVSDGPAVRGCFARTVARFDLGGRAALLHPDRTATGVPYETVVEFVASSDVLVNLGGALKDPEVLGPASTRVYVDLDPAFTQLWHAEAIDMGLADHDIFLTVGQRVGTAGCRVPACGVTWHPLLPPVVLDEWPVCEAVPRHGWTTVANWRSYGSVVHGGVHHGQKAHAFRALVDLPRATAAQLQVALGIHGRDGADRQVLEGHGWQLLDPVKVAGDPDAYRTFVQDSTGEIGVAKTGYVVSRSGWFSDRSASYLASGRPVVAQDTGWPDVLPSGEGLLPFTDVASAVDSISEVNADYERHAKAARGIALDLLDARRVLTGLLDVAAGS